LWVSVPAAPSGVDRHPAHGIDHDLALFALICDRGEELYRLGDVSKSVDTVRFESDPFDLPGALAGRVGHQHRPSVG
jgi:hypothetical protein